MKNIDFNTFLEKKDEIFDEYETKTKDEDYQTPFLDWLKKEYPEHVEHYFKYMKEL